jgi:uncharacterized C2H2 Zn-finger protein
VLARAYFRWSAEGWNATTKDGEQVRACLRCTFIATWHQSLLHHTIKQHRPRAGAEQRSGSVVQRIRCAESRFDRTPDAGACWRVQWPSDGELGQLKSSDEDDTIWYFKASPDFLGARPTCPEP